jgi:hypothetical protein
MADRLAASLVRDVGKNALDQRPQIQPFIRGVLQTAVVKVVSINVDAGAKRAFVFRPHESDTQICKNRLAAVFAPGR